jgi:cytochrome o ubiquinol oxidase subunit 1
MKKSGYKPSKQYADILMPKNTGMGIYISLFAFIFAFAIVWHIYWLAIFGIVGAIVCVIIVSFDEHMEYVLPAAEVTQIETAKGGR